MYRDQKDTIAESMAEDLELHGSDKGFVKSWTHSGRRFAWRETEKHYVMAGRLVTVGLFFAASGTVYLLDSAKQTFDIILQVGAGTGLLYLVRWFWWRVNAWSEVVAMVSSFAISVVILVLNKNGAGISSHAALLFTVAVTTVGWVATAYWGPETDRATLIAFYRRVRPFGPGWARVRTEAGIPAEEAPAAGQNIPLALLGWAAGCAVIWSSLFTVGNFLYGRTGYALALLAVFAAATAVLLYVINRLWSGGQGGPAPGVQETPAGGSRGAAGRSDP